ncbi:MAG: DEAD/DEAH box helicase [Verrucomicrobia bacterium]|nr:DEAD/DEAH box helicase [Verrucomicrobiota bacterium]
MLRFHLPPNLAAAIGRNAVPLRVEVDLGPAPEPAELPALALLQRWSGTDVPPKFIQLSCPQLRELVRAIDGEPWFVENARPTVWQHDHLLALREQPAPSAAPSTIARPGLRLAPPPAPLLLIDGSEHFLAITLPDREHPRYAQFLSLVKDHGFTLEPSNRKWWLRDRHKTLGFLARHLSRLRSSGEAAVTANFERNTAHLVFADVTTEVRAGTGGFEIALGLRAPGASDDDVRSALAGSRGYVEAGKQIVLLDPDRLEKLAAAQRALSGDPAAQVAARRVVRLSSARVPEAETVLEQLSPDFAPPESWRARSAALRHLTTLEPAPIPPFLEPQLRPYQRLGTAWLWHLHRHQLGGILADEMGLGKTLQALALLSALAAARERASSSPLTCLVVCPASLLENWRREAARFAPQLRVFVHHAANRLETVAAAAARDLIITSYGTLTRDAEFFASLEFVTVVADEAQHIKNRRSQNAAVLRSLRARSRFLLTGTPLENSLDDLRSLFEFLLPGYLQPVPTGVRGEDRGWYDERLRAQTAPYILRRTKRAVAPELPARLEQVLWCDLSSAQAALYRSTQERGERDLFDLEAGGASEARLRLAAFTQLLRLRQICCDPRLLAPTALSAEANPPAPAYTAADSGKLDALIELLAEAVDDRQAEVDRFQSSPEIPVFLLSLKAGGTGLNLTGADTVVHFDPWWNPAVEAQATDRAHRLGQTRVVTSYKLIAAGTVEEKVLALQAEKRALLANVFEASDAAAAKLSLADLRSLLR